MIKFFRDKILQGVVIFKQLPIDEMEQFHQKAKRIELEMMPAIIPEILGFQKYKQQELLEIFDYKNGKTRLFKDLSEMEGHYTLCREYNDHRFELWVANNYQQEAIYSNLNFNSNYFTRTKIVSKYEYPFMFFNGCYEFEFENGQHVYADALNYRCFHELTTPEYINTAFMLYSKNIEPIESEEKAIISLDKTIIYEDKFAYKPECIIKGELIKQEIVKNPVSSYHFLALYVNTGSTVIVVLTKADFINDIFNDGDYIQAEGWLSCSIDL